MRSLPFLSLALPLATAFPHYQQDAHGWMNKISEHARAKSSNRNSTGGLTWKHFTWAPPGKGDIRSPCPMLNTLANHGFLPHNGRNITSDVFVQGSGEAFNFHPGAAAGAFTTGVGANPEPNATWLDLDMLHLHGFIEHDGSLSRRDSFFDPTNKFDPKTFANLLSYFGDDQLLNVSATSNARARHAFDMSLVNPTFMIPESALTPIMGENAMMLAVWGSLSNPTANRSYYEYFFRNERLPVELGWRPSAEPIGPTVGQIVQDLIALHPSDVPLLYPPQNGTSA